MQRLFPWTIRPWTYHPFFLPFIRSLGCVRRSSIVWSLVISTFADIFFLSVLQIFCGMTSQLVRVLLPLLVPDINPYVGRAEITTCIKFYKMCTFWKPIDKLILFLTKDQFGDNSSEGRMLKGVHCKKVSDFPSPAGKIADLFYSVSIITSVWKFGESNHIWGQVFGKSRPGTICNCEPGILPPFTKCTYLCGRGEKITAT